MFKFLLVVGGNRYTAEFVQNILSNFGRIIFDRVAFWANISDDFIA
ncbi:hypothetical protein [Lacticaseibacillus paracasei]|nr:hypothetical protein [Lacticaseibacillus paracasei]